MGSLEVYIRKNYNIQNNEDKDKILTLLDGVDSEEKAYSLFECKYSKTNRLYLYHIANIVGFDMSIYKERRKKVVKYCIKCNKPLSKGQKKFCSESCAAKYNNMKRGKMSEEQKQQISQTLREGYKNKKYKKQIKTRICIVCKKPFIYKKGENTKKICSDECRREYSKNRSKYMTKEGKLRISLNARKVVEKLGGSKRSKNEKEFCELCEKHFNDVEHNKAIFNGWDADIIIHDYKIAILWNGAWHYKQISKTSSLVQIQNRDNIKINEIRKYGYIPYIIQDMGRYNKEKIYNEFEKLKLFINERNIAV